MCSREKFQEPLLKSRKKVLRELGVYPISNTHLITMIWFPADLNG